MATVSDLYTAMFGYPAQREAVKRYQQPAFDTYKMVTRNWFMTPMTTSNGDTLDVRVDASKAFYSIFTLSDFTYSKTHKNYTLSKGTRGQARTSITMPKASVLKKNPAFLQMLEDNRTWIAARDAAATAAIDEGMRNELSGVMPDYQEILDLTDETARAYFESNGWTIPSEVTFDNWRPCGWILTSRPDGFGHDCGSYANVDWDNKTFTISGWSSDD